MSTDKKNLKELLSKCEKDRDEYLDGWKRSKADYINEKKRLVDEFEIKSQEKQFDCIKEFLNVLDSIDIAIKTSADKSGLEEIKKQFLNSLKKLGVKKIECLGKKFDPSVHEAVRSVNVEINSESGIIKEITRDGYILGDKLLRSPQVIISLKK